MPTLSSADIRVLIEAKQVLSNLGIASGVVPVRFEAFTDLLNGTATGKIDRAYYVRETGKAASGTTTYDLSGSLTDVYGNAVVFAEVALIAIKNLRNTASAYIEIGPGDTNPVATGANSFWGTTSSKTRVPASATTGQEGWVIMYSGEGQPIAAGSADTIDVDTSGVAGDTNSWDLLILGRSA
jgi:hypothetical protein